MPVQFLGALRRLERATSNSISRIGLLPAVSSSIAGATPMGSTTHGSASNASVKHTSVALIYTRPAQPTEASSGWSETVASKSRCVNMATGITFSANFPGDHDWHSFIGITSGSADVRIGVNDFGGFKPTRGISVGGNPRLSRRGAHRPRRTLATGHVCYSPPRTSPPGVTIHSQCGAI